MKIGFFGTGLMGEPMAEKLLKAGYELGVYNRSVEKTVYLKTLGAEVFGSPSALVERSELVISMLSDFPAIENVFLKIPEEKFEQKTFINMSTVSPDENLFLANYFNSVGCAFLEAPVLGSIPQVKEGKLIVIVGGEKTLLGKYELLFKTLGEEIVYMGELPKASATKLALNQLIATLTAAFSMSLGFVRESGADMERFMNILRKSALYAPTFDKKLDRMMERNFKNPNFPLKHLLKDVNLMIDSFSKSGIDVETLKGVRKVIKKGLSRGLNENDYSALYNAVHNK